MQWYGDNSELNGIWNAELPDILLFGGIVIRKDSIKRLCEVITRNKIKYSDDPFFPIKYNLRDLRSWFDRRGKASLYRRMLRKSKEWRRSIIEESLECEYTIVVACVNIFGRTAGRIRQSKEKVTKFCFADALMRVALLAQEYKAPTCDVILDWPDGNRYVPYTEEYRSAYVSGCCHDYPLNRYYSGPLKDVGFSESPFFTRMEDCSLLQFSDLVVGATREFVDYCLGKRARDSFGVQLTNCLVPKFRGYPHRIVGRGISVSPPGGTLKEKLFKGMVELRYGSFH
jgi:hypothetical protein